MSHRKEIKSWPVSRVLSRTVIPLGSPSLTTSSNLPESSAGHTNGFLFGLAPSGVYHATDCYQLRGALLPHLFTLTGAYALRRFALCCTFRRLTPPRRYLALCPMEPGLSSLPTPCGANTATVQPTLGGKVSRLRPTEQGETTSRRPDHAFLVPRSRASWYS